VAAARNGVPEEEDLFPQGRVQPVRVLHVGVQGPAEEEGVAEGAHQVGLLPAHTAVDEKKREGEAGVAGAGAGFAPLQLLQHLRGDEEDGGAEAADEACEVSRRPGHPAQVEERVPLHHVDEAGGHLPG
jgi:hypothetical protein